jgi:GxxExxY protein
MLASKKPIPPELNEVTGKIVDSAYEVHSNLGPGLIENVYETCLIYELNLRGLRFERQKTLPIKYKEVGLENALRIDLLVENSIVVELKSVEKLLPVHETQLLTYLKLIKSRLGLLINFNRVLKSIFQHPVDSHGIERAI